MAVLDVQEKINLSSQRLKSPEAALGKGLMIPYVGTDSGARKILASIQREHVFPLIAGEKAIIETGYEIRFGDYSSSVIRAESDYRVIAKISKFSFAPNHHYWLILSDLHSKRLDVVERISYHHITECYGYLNNNDFIDTLEIGSQIHNDQIVSKSLAFDEYNNRADGVNFNTLYLALDDNMEDSVILSDEAAGRLTATSIKPVQIMINNNDIPLNIYGDDKVYKVIPDIGEDVIDGTLIALRKEKKSEALFAEAVENLSRITMPDELKQVHGKVLDIDIRCNNPDILEKHQYAQIKMYQNELMRRANEIVQIILPYVSDGYQLSYDLQKLFAISKRQINGDLYIDKNPFSNIILNVTVFEEQKMSPGDKGSNRHGGKGVVSIIYPKKMMPRFKNSDGEYEYVDIIFNSSTMINRENVGQCIEITLTHISRGIITHIKEANLTPDEAMELIMKYYQFVSAEEAEFISNEMNKMAEEDKMFFLEGIINDGEIHISAKPLSDTITIDTIAEMYKAFPFVKQDIVEVPIINSMGELRYVPARRPMVVGKQYYLRLKQYAEEKFSATSLSATNIKNENAKSKAKKDFRDLYSNTPIHFGNMETNNQLHLGAEVVISTLMIHSVSPIGRRLVQQMYTGDPYKIDIKLNSDSVNRAAEISNTYLKAIGRRLVFYKTKKRIEKILEVPITFEKDPIDYPISFVPEDQRKGFDYIKDFKDRQKLLEKLEKIESPVRFDGRKRR